jgi:aromatic ring-cleaving dioxygenase
MAEIPHDITTIASYHAHVYYDPARTRDAAARLRAWVEDRFPVTMGRWHDVPVGPHPLPMFQIAFATDLFARLVPWLMLNRQGLTILVHPETDRPKDDHLIHAIWFGEVLPLNAAMLPQTREQH